MGCGFFRSEICRSVLEMLVAVKSLFVFVEYFVVYRDNNYVFFVALGIIQTLRSRNKIDKNRAMIDYI